MNGYKNFWQALAKTKLFKTFCINHQPTSPPTKTIKGYVCSATNPTTFPRKLKIAPKALPTIAGNSSTAFPASLLSVFASLSNHFFNTPSSFGGGPPAPPPPQKIPVVANIIVETVIEKAVSIENILMPCSENKVRILSANDVLRSRTFSRVCLILVTCVWRSFDSLTVFVALPVFWYSSRLICPCITAFVHKYKWDRFLLLQTFWYLVWYTY